MLMRKLWDSVAKAIEIQNVAHQEGCHVVILEGEKDPIIRPLAKKDEPIVLLAREFSDIRPKVEQLKLDMKTLNDLHDRESIDMPDPLIGLSRRKPNKYTRAGQRLLRLQKK